LNAKAQPSLDGVQRATAGKREGRYEELSDRDRFSAPSRPDRGTRRRDNATALSQLKAELFSGFVIPRASTSRSVIE
jgi:hypothetical protein